MFPKFKRDIYTDQKDCFGFFYVPIFPARLFQLFVAQNSGQDFLRFIY